MNERQLIKKKIMITFCLRKNSEKKKQNKKKANANLNSMLCQYMYTSSFLYENCQVKGFNSLQPKCFTFLPSWVPKMYDISDF